MIRFGLFALAVLLPAHAAGNNVIRRLQVEQDVDRRRNAIDALTNPFEYVFNDLDWLVDIGDVFVDGWNEVEEFFTEDFVHFFETDFVHFVETFQEQPIGGPLSDVDYTKVWNDFVHGMESAWEWTEGAAETVWAPFEQAACVADKFMDDIQDKESCTKCQKDSCNKQLDKAKIDQIDAANGVALMDMEDGFDPLFEGCASALQSCTPVEDCKALSALTGSAQQYVGSEIAQCNLCYECLPYGSTTEGCQMALDSVMPNNCQGCTESQQQMYNAFYSCSSLEALYNSIKKLGQNYAAGGKGHESNDKMCESCEHCSDYTSELEKTCEDWTLISKPHKNVSWDCTPPVIPNALLPGGSRVPTWAPTPGPPTPMPTREPTTRPPTTPRPTPPTMPPTYVGEDPTCATARLPRTVGGRTYSPLTCCRCYSDEYPNDWDNGVCCGHCKACQDYGR